jgi:ArsR family transcriptional regulator
MVDILKALADDTRLRIISQVIKGEMCVCEIEKCLGLTQSNASRHLNILKKAGILDSYKNAQWTYYKMSEEFIDNNKELYDYIKIKVSTLPCYADDCKEYDCCKQQDLCNK